MKIGGRKGEKKSGAPFLGVGPDGPMPVDDPKHMPPTAPVGAAGAKYKVEAKKKESLASRIRHLISGETKDSEKITSKKQEDLLDDILVKEKALGVRLRAFTGIPGSVGTANVSSMNLNMDGIAKALSSMRNNLPLKHSNAKMYNNTYVAVLDNKIAFYRAAREQWLKEFEGELKQYQVDREAKVASLEIRRLLGARDDKEDAPIENAERNLNIAKAFDRLYDPNRDPADTRKEAHLRLRALLSAVLSEDRDSKIANEENVRAAIQLATKTSWASVEEEQNELQELRDLCANIIARYFPANGSFTDLEARKQWEEASRVSEPARKASTDPDHLDQLVTASREAFAEAAPPTDPVKNLTDLFREDGPLYWAKLEAKDAKEVDDVLVTLAGDEPLIPIPDSVRDIFTNIGNRTGFHLQKELQAEFLTHSQFQTLLRIAHTVRDAPEAKNLADELKQVTPALAKVGDGLSKMDSKAIAEALTELARPDHRPRPLLFLDRDVPGIPRDRDARIAYMAQSIFAAVQYGAIHESLPPGHDPQIIKDFLRTLPGRDAVEAWVKEVGNLNPFNAYQRMHQKFQELKQEFDDIPDSNPSTSLAVLRNQDRQYEELAKKFERYEAAARTFVSYRTHIMEDQKDELHIGVIQDEVSAIQKMIDEKRRAIHGALEDREAAEKKFDAYRTELTEKTAALTKAVDVLSRDSGVLSDPGDPPFMQPVPPSKHVPIIPTKEEIQRINIAGRAASVLHDNPPTDLPKDLESKVEKLREIELKKLQDGSAKKTEGTERRLVAEKRVDQLSKWMENAKKIAEDTRVDINETAAQIEAKQKAFQDQVNDNFTPTLLRTNRLLRCLQTDEQKAELPAKKTAAADAIDAKRLEFQQTLDARRGMQKAVDDRKHDLLVAYKALDDSIMAWKPLPPTRAQIDASDIARAEVQRKLNGVASDLAVGGRYEKFPQDLKDDINTRHAQVSALVTPFNTAITTADTAWKAQEKAVNDQIAKLTTASQKASADVQTLLNYNPQPIAPGDLKSQLNQLAAKQINNETKYEPARDALWGPPPAWAGGVRQESKNAQALLANTPLPTDLKGVLDAQIKTAEEQQKANIKKYNTKTGLLAIEHADERLDALIQALDHAHHSGDVRDKKELDVECAGRELKKWEDKLADNFEMLREGVAPPPAAPADQALEKQGQALLAKQGDIIKKLDTIREKYRTFDALSALTDANAKTQEDNLKTWIAKKVDGAVTAAKAIGGDEAAARKGEEERIRIINKHIENPLIRLRLIHRGDNLGTDESRIYRVLNRIGPPPGFNMYMRLHPEANPGDPNLTAPADFRFKLSEFFHDLKYGEKADPPGFEYKGPLDKHGGIDRNEAQDVADHNPDFARWANAKQLAVNNIYRAFADNPKAIDLSAPDDKSAKQDESKSARHQTNLQNTFVRDLLIERGAALSFSREKEIEALRKFDYRKDSYQDFLAKLDQVLILPPQPRDMKAIVSEAEFKKAKGFHLRNREGEMAHECEQRMKYLRERVSTIKEETKELIRRQKELQLGAQDPGYQMAIDTLLRENFRIKRGDADLLTLRKFDYQTSSWTQFKDIITKLTVPPPNDAFIKNLFNDIKALPPGAAPVSPEQFKQNQMLLAKTVDTNLERLKVLRDEYETLSAMYKEFKDICAREGRPPDREMVEGLLHMPRFTQPNPRLGVGPDEKDVADVMKALDDSRSADPLVKRAAEAKLAGLSRMDTWVTMIANADHKLAELAERKGEIEKEINELQHLRNSIPEEYRRESQQVVHFTVTADVAPLSQLQARLQRLGIVSQEDGSRLDIATVEFKKGQEVGAQLTRPLAHADEGRFCDMYLGARGGNALFVDSIVEKGSKEDRLVGGSIEVVQSKVYASPEKMGTASIFVQSDCLKNALDDSSRTALFRTLDTWLRDNRYLPTKENMFAFFKQIQANPDFLRLQPAFRRYYEENPGVAQNPQQLAALIERESKRVTAHISQYSEYMTGMTTLWSMAKELESAYKERIEQKVTFTEGFNMDWGVRGVRENIYPGWQTIPSDEDIRLAKMLVHNARAHDTSVTEFVVKEVKRPSLLWAIDLEVQLENKRRTALGLPESKSLIWVSETDYGVKRATEKQLAFYMRHFREKIAPTMDPRFTQVSTLSDVQANVARIQAENKAKELQKRTEHKPDKPAHVDLKTPQRSIDQPDVPGRKQPGR